MKCQPYIFATKKLRGSTSTTLTTVKLLYVSSGNFDQIKKVRKFKKMVKKIRFKSCSLAVIYRSRNFSKCKKQCVYILEQCKSCNFSFRHVFVGCKMATKVYGGPAHSQAITELQPTAHCRFCWFRNVAQLQSLQSVAQVQFYQYF